MSDNKILIKKIIIPLFIFYLLVFALILVLDIPSTTTRTFKLNNGYTTKINVINKDYNIEAKNSNSCSFYITKDKNDLAKGFFIKSNTFNEIKKLGNSNNVINFETGKIDKNEYVYYELKDSGLEYIIIKFKKIDLGIEIVSLKKSNGDLKGLLNNITLSIRKS